MGRWLMVLDGVPTVFDTDALRPIIAVAESLTGRAYLEGDAEADVALRVIGDHARTMTFLVNDGVVHGMPRWFFSAQWSLFAAAWVVAGLAAAHLIGRPIPPAALFLSATGMLACVKVWHVVSASERPPDAG